MCCIAASSQGFAVHTQAMALSTCGESPVAQSLAAQVPVPCLAALPPLLGRPVALELCVLSVSVSPPCCLGFALTSLLQRCRGLREPISINAFPFFT